MSESQITKFYKRVQKIVKRGHVHKWKIIRTTFPYPSGWGTYCRGCRTLLDSGLQKEVAQKLADELNQNTP